MRRYIVEVDVVHQHQHYAVNVHGVEASACISDQQLAEFAGSAIADHVVANPYDTPVVSTIEFKEENGVKSAEWSQESTHILDLAGISDSTIAVLEKLHELYEQSWPEDQAEIRGALRVVEDGYTNGYLAEESETLMRVYELFARGDGDETRRFDAEEGTK